MRIGIVTQSFYPVHGGVAEHVYHTAKELEKRGHQVMVITANFDVFGGDQDYGLDVIRIGRDLTIPSNAAFVNITIGLEMGKKLQAIEKKKQLDIVHIHSPLEPIMPMVALKAMKTPKVGTFHSYKKFSIPYIIWGDKAKEYDRLLDGRIAVSKAAKSFISKYFPGDYRIIPNGVDTERFSPAIKPLKKFQDGNLNLLFVGRMDPRKGFKYLLKAFPLIYQKLGNVRLIVVGNGILRSYYNFFLPDILRPRVHYEGFVSYQDLPRYYRTGDIYISPATRGESFGIVLLEAMASGKPVVASRIEGYKEVISDQEGILIEPRNPLAIAEAVIKLAKNKKLREEKGRKGRAKALKYSWEKITQKIEQYYLEVLEKTKKK